MNHFFGTAKPSTPTGAGIPSHAAAGPGLSSTSKQMDGRIQELDDKIRKCDEDIMECMKNRMGRNGNLAKQKAVQIMKRKKMLESQRTQMMGTQLNIDQVMFTQENMTMTAQTVNALAASTAVMKNQMKAIDVDRVADLMDDQQDLMMDMDEINEMMTRNYALDGIDEADLDAEFEQIEAEIKMEDYNKMMSGSAVPSYMPDSAPGQAVKNPPASNPELSAQEAAQLEALKLT